MMRTGWGTLCVMLCVTVASLAFASEGKQGSGATAVWSEAPPLPGTPGLGGCFVGTYGEALIVTGGANFPQAPPWETEQDGVAIPPGEKVWHDDIYVLAKDAKQWVNVGRLGEPRGYGAAVSTDEGVYLIGGSDAEKCFAKVTVLQWSDGVTTETESVPLPVTSAHLSAELVGSTIYVVAGKVSKDFSTAVKRFWAMDLAKPRDEREWVDLEPWPGPPRVKAQTAVQSHGWPTKRLYIFGGEHVITDAQGATIRNYLKDVYRYNPTPKPDEPHWVRLADMPRTLAAGTAMAVGQSHVLLFGGSSGRHIHKPIEERPEFSREIQAYHAITDTWAPFGEMPLGVVATQAARLGGKVVIATGEIRPGVRTPTVNILEIKPPEGSFGWINYSILFAYLGTLVAMGFYFSKREKGTDDYFLAGRRIPWWAAGLSIYATQLSAITFVATPAVGYARDWLVYPAKISILLFVPIVIAFYLPFFRRLNLTTAYEYLEKRFNVVIRLYGTFSFTFFQFVRMGIVVYLPALALSVITGMNIYAAILLMGVLAILYTTLGGIEAVVWTDVLQVFVLLGGMLISFILITVDAGGVGAIYDTALADGKLAIFDWRWSWTEMVSLSIFVGVFCLQMGPYTTDQAVIQRYMTTKDEKAARKSLWMNGLMSIPGSFLFFVMGTCMFVYFKGRPEALTVGMDNDKIFPLFVAGHLPVGLSGLVIAGIFAASMSTLDSGMHSVATALTTDIYRRWNPNAPDHRVLVVARWLTVIVGAIGTGVALILAGFDIQSLFFHFQKMLGLISSALVGIFILGIFTRRANWIGALLGAVTSLAVVFYLKFQTPIHFYFYAIIGIPTCVLVGYVSSLVFPNANKDVTGLTYATLARGRGKAAEGEAR